MNLASAIACRKLAGWKIANDDHVILRCCNMLVAKHLNFGHMTAGFIYMTVMVVNMRTVHKSHFSEPL